MSLIAPMRRSFEGRPAPLILVICIVGLVLFGDGAAHDLRRSDGHASHSLAGHGHRQWLDHNDSEWLSTPPAVLSIPRPVVPSNLVPAFEPFLDAVFSAWHCDRPPPAC